MKTFSQFIQFLIEDRIDTLKEKYKNISTEHDPDGKHKGEAIVKHFADKADPSPNKEHTQWILNQYKKGHIKQEDHPRIHETLSNFRKYKNKLPQKDLNGYKHIADVDDALKPHVGTMSSEREKVRDIKSKGAELIHKENGVTVHKLKTKEAACTYGKGTKWCTAARRNNMFDHYNSKGPLYHVHAKNDNGGTTKYQFHHQTDSYMDDQDRRVNLDRLVKRNPELKNVKEWQGIHPKLTNDEHFDSHFKELIKNNPHETIADSRVNKEHLHQALDHSDENIKMKALSHPNIDSDHLSKAVKDKNFKIKAAALSHPKANEKHIDAGLNDDHEELRGIAARHPKASHEQIHKGLNDKSTDVRVDAMRNPSANHEHIEKGMNDPHWEVREAAAKHKNATEEQLKKLSNDSDDDVAHIAKIRLKNK